LAQFLKDRSPKNGFVDAAAAAIRLAGLDPQQKSHDRSIGRPATENGHSDSGWDVAVSRVPAAGI
jgi:hypothetical protein